MSFWKSTVKFHAGVKVLFDGSRSFCSNRVNIDIVLVLHVEHSSIELVAFNPALGLKAPRLYLNYLALKAQLDPESIDCKIAELKALSINQKKHMGRKDAFTKATEEMCIDYIFNRLDVIKGCTTENFAMVLNIFPGDRCIFLEDENGEIREVLQVISACPKILVPVVIIYKKVPSSRETRRALKQLLGCSMELHEAVHLAVLLESSMHGFKNAMELKQKIAEHNSRLLTIWKKVLRKMVTKSCVIKMRERLRHLGLLPSPTRAAGRRGAGSGGGGGGGGGDGLSIVIPTAPLSRKNTGAGALTPSCARSPKLSYSLPSVTGVRTGGISPKLTKSTMGNSMHGKGSRGNNEARSIDSPAAGSAAAGSTKAHISQSGGEGLGNSFVKAGARVVGSSPAAASTSTSTVAQSMNRPVHMDGGHGRTQLPLISSKNSGDRDSTTGLFHSSSVDTARDIDLTRKANSHPNRHRSVSLDPLEPQPGCRPFPQHFSSSTHSPTPCPRVSTGAGARKRGEQSLTRRSYPSLIYPTQRDRSRAWKYGQSGLVAMSRYRQEVEEDPFFGDGTHPLRPCSTANASRATSWLVMDESLPTGGGRGPVPR